MARIELLAGEFKKAAWYFQRLLKSIKTFEAEGRMKFELKLAKEFTSIDFMRLYEARKQKLPVPPEILGLEENEKETISGEIPLLGKSAFIKKIKKEITQLESLDATVLVRGETGTGKELVARALHYQSKRRIEPFLALNCGALAETLLEAELFGFTKGAYTGAIKGSRGLFEDAGKGSIFLDEIGEISPRMQIALLRVLEKGEIRAVGSSQSRKIHCRIIAATNRDLKQMVTRGEFRKDLYYRLNSMEITIPPLRERKSDILTLALHFLNLERDPDRKAEFSTDLEECLTSYTWPGNVRELKAAIEKARLLHSDEQFFTLNHITLPGMEKASEGKVILQKDDDLISKLEEPLDRENSVDSQQTIEKNRIKKILREGKGRFRRLNRIREMFKDFPALTRKEIAKIIGITPQTTTSDLKILCDEGLIRKVKPSLSPQTHYFVLND